MNDHQAVNRDVTDRKVTNCRSLLLATCNLQPATLLLVTLLLATLLPSLACVIGGSGGTADAGFSQTGPCPWHAPPGCRVHAVHGRNNPRRP